jgi:cytidylate kinase
MIVTIDGPAASGKGTLARRIAEHLGLPHLDTGLLYRAVPALIDGRQPNDAAAAQPSLDSFARWVAQRLAGISRPHRVSPP